MGTDDNDDKMGVDLDRHHVASGHRKAPHSDNPYLKLLHKLFSFLPGRTDSKFNQTVLRRLRMSKVNRPPISLSKICAVTNNPSSAKAYEGKIRAVVGAVTDDNRLYEVPKMTLCASPTPPVPASRRLAANASPSTSSPCAPRLARMWSSSVAPRTPVRPSSTSALAPTRTRSRTWRARAGSSSVPVAGDGRAVSRCKGGARDEGVRRWKAVVVRAIRCAVADSDQRKRWSWFWTALSSMERQMALLHGPCR